MFTMLSCLTFFGVFVQYIVFFDCFELLSLICCFLTQTWNLIVKQFLTSQILHQRTTAEGLISALLFLQQLNSQEMFIDSGCPGRVPIYKSLDLGMPE